MGYQLNEDDVMQRLEQYRPEPSSHEWGTAERSAALATALDTDAASRVHFRPAGRRRGWVAIAGGVAAAAAAVLVVELVPSGSHQQSGGTSHRPSTHPTHTATSVSSSPAPPGPVARLAGAARHTSLGNPHRGQYWYQSVRVGTADSTSNWVAQNGDDWLDTADASGRSCTYYKYVGTPNPNHVNATYLRSLPTEAHALYSYLQAHVTGSGSTVEAIFVAVGDMLHYAEGLVTPDLRAALIEVLARVPSVTVRSHVAYGDIGSATTFTYKNRQSLWFDETTAQVVYKNGAPVYRVIDSLPTRVADRKQCPRGSN